MTNHFSRWIFTLILWVYCLNLSFAQNIKTVLQGVGLDSSFYHIARINENEFWVGGKYGVLKKIDTLGNVSSIDMPTLGLNILKIERINQYVFLTTNKDYIFRYDLKNNTFIHKKIEGFEDKCFYDLIATKNNEIIVCGGNSKISSGKKGIPNGFVITFDENFENIKTLWKSKRRFAWSVIEHKNELHVSTFNGLFTKIIRYHNSKKWKKVDIRKGLIHELFLFNNEIVSSGSPKISYQKDGLISNEKLTQSFLQIGCIWSSVVEENSILSVTNSGNVLKFNPQLDIIQTIPFPQNLPLYDIEKISSNKFFVIGNRKSIYLLTF